MSDQGGIGLDVSGGEVLPTASLRCGRRPARTALRFSRGVGEALLRGAAAELLIVATRIRASSSVQLEVVGNLAEWDITREGPCSDASAGREEESEQTRSESSEMHGGWRGRMAALLRIDRRWSSVGGNPIVPRSVAAPVQRLRGRFSAHSTSRT